MPKLPPKAHHDHELLKFPKDFLWGTASSAFQVEGNNVNADWWIWEEKNQPKEKRSGDATDGYHKYEEDFNLAKSIGLNAQRISIEWSRIEPIQGQFDQVEIDHYIEELKTLKNLGFTVMLTLHHFTNPLWFAKKGGWESFAAPIYFENFVKKIVPYLKDYVDLWITINEPGIYTFMSYLGGDEAGRFPPAKKSNVSALKVTLNLARGHKAAYNVIHQLIKNAKVGIAQNVSSFEAFHKHSVVEQFAVGISDLVTNHSFYFLTKGYHDFLGLNYYFNYRFNAREGLTPKIVNPQETKEEVSDLGWEVYPEGLFDVLTDLSDGLPIYITESGIASTNDDRRTRFLISFLQEVYRAIQAGINVKGYFYWSLTDNFEWHRGFDPRFGLVEINYSTQKRTPRPSYEVYGDIVRHNGIPHELLKLLGHGLQVKKEMKEIMKGENKL